MTTINIETAPAQTVEITKEPAVVEEKVIKTERVIEPETVVITDDESGGDTVTVIDED